MSIKSDRILLCGRTGKRMKIVETQNFSPVKVKLWMAENCICPESFYEGCVMPGNTVEWMRSYCFGI